jgi:hypothetical protein
VISGEDQGGPEGRRLYAMATAVGREAPGVARAWANWLVSGFLAKGNVSF